MITISNHQKVSQFISLIGLLCLIVAGVISFFDKGFGITLWILAQVVFLIITACLLMYLARRDAYEKLEINKFLSIYFVLYLLWLIIAPYFSTWYDLSRMTAWGLALTPFLFYIGSILNVNTQIKKILVICYLLVGIILFIWANLHFYVTNERPSGPLIDTNVFSGLLLFFLIPACVYLITSKKSPKQKINIDDYLYVYLIFGFLAFFATRSRSAFIAFVIVGFLLILKIFQEYKFRVLKKCSIIFSLMLVSWLAVNYHLSFSAGPSFTNLAQDRSTQIRFEIWKTSFEIVKKKPLLGEGFGQFKAIYKLNRTPEDNVSSGDYAHNDYIQFLVEGGVIQFLFFLVLSMYIIYLYTKLFFTRVKVVELEKRNNLLLLAGISTICVFFIQANANFIFYLLPNAMIIGLVLGYITRNMPLKKIKFKLTKKVKILIALSALFAVSTLVIDTYIQQNYLQVKNVQVGENFNKKFKKSELLIKLRPRSLALARYQFVSHAQKFEAGGNIQLIDEAYSKLNEVSPDDAFSLHYLGRFSEKHFDDYLRLQKFTEKSEIYLDAEKLYLKSIERDPSLIISYYRLRKIYQSSNDKEKAYRLFYDKLYPRFDYGELGFYNELRIAGTMMNDAVDLGYKNDASEFANLILGVNPCHVAANQTLEIILPEKCSNEQTIMF